MHPDLHTRYTLSPSAEPESIDKRFVALAHAEPRDTPPQVPLSSGRSNHM